MLRLLICLWLGFVGYEARAATPIAEILCAPTPDLEHRLTRQMGSARSASGLRSPGQIMEVWTSPKGRWTLVIRHATGTSCIVAMGDHWEHQDDMTAG